MHHPSGAIGTNGELAIRVAEDACDVVRLLRLDAIDKVADE
jgi:hypothetical protein